ncbi:hypothetical protein KPL39_18040 [Clostridium gasigenes]|uniref:hypothetical protein n=1 Tax=Clostridium gasigenes TaxID=94869 RepID=UPI001C0D286E|nr:hypothetical protein [Clostridium gasigenes]MBU3138134.1 hypothetical protein [Clostridium gasigenes]
MKKRKIGLIVVAIAILTMGIGGCSKEKIVIVDTNVQDSKNIGVNISEETINLKTDDNTDYLPRYFDGDKICGTVRLSSGGIIENGTEEYPILGIMKKDMYTLESDASIKVTDREPMFYNWGITESKGIVVDDINAMIESDHSNDIYYYDDKIGEKRKLGKTYSLDNEESIGRREGETQMIEGQSEFAYTMLNERECEVRESKMSGEGKISGEDKLLNLQILGVNNGEKYEYNGTGILPIGDIVYSKITDKFYAIDVKGKLYNVEMKDNETKFIEVDNIDIKWLDSINEGSVSVNDNGEILIFNKLDYGQVLIIIYNPKTKQTTYINKGDDENTRILKYFTEGNKVILVKKNSDDNDEIYVGELKDNYMKIYTKLDVEKDEEEYLGFSDAIVSDAIMSDDGKKMLVSQCVFKEGNELKPDKRYVYKILTFN